MTAKCLKVLVGCETSGVVRRAFSAHGHDAWSCDLLPSEDGSNRHIIGDVRDLLDEGWDLLAVMHPPCTRLCRSGHRWLYGPGKTRPKKLPKGRSWESMISEFEEACALFEACLHAPIERRAIENPRMHIHAKERIRDLPEPQIVQPWWFGEPYFKATGFSLVNLPPLQPTDMLDLPERGTPEFKRWEYIFRMPPGPERWKARSRTFPGIAAAMADQWGGYAEDAARRMA